MCILGDISENDAKFSKRIIYLLHVKKKKTYSIVYEFTRKTIMKRKYVLEWNQSRVVLKFQLPNSSFEEKNNYVFFSKFKTVYNI